MEKREENEIWEGQIFRVGVAHFVLLASKTIHYIVTKQPNAHHESQICRVEEFDWDLKEPTGRYINVKIKRVTANHLGVKEGFGILSISVEKMCTGLDYYEEIYIEKRIELDIAIMKAHQEQAKTDSESDDGQTVTEPAG